MLLGECLVMQILGCHITGLGEATFIVPPVADAMSSSAVVLVARSRVYFF
jgi:hypothetical protein